MFIRFYFLIMVTHLFTFSAYPAPSVEPPVPAEWADYPVVMLYDSVRIDLKLNSRGNTLTIKEICRYSVQRNSPPLLQQLSYGYNEYTEGQPQVAVTTYDHSGVKHVLGSDYVSIDKSIDDPEVKYNLMVHKTGVYSVNVNIPSYDHVRYIRTELTRNNVKAAFMGRLFIRSAYPVVRKVVTVSVPAGMENLLTFINNEAMEYDSTGKTQGKRSIIQYCCGPLKAKPVPAVHNAEKWLSMLAFRFPPLGIRPYSWVELGDYYLGLIESSQQTSDNVVAAAAQLPSGVSAASVAAFEYLQKHTRYYGSWEGMYGFVPRPSGEVLKNGYGDCKELAMLMCALLREKGVVAFPALVSARSYFPQMNEQFPTLGVFNHVIVAVIDSGRIRYFDPTITVSNAGNSYYKVLGRKTLIIRKGASTVDSVGEGPGFSNAVTTVSTIVAGDNGRWYLEGTIGQYGLAAMDFEEQMRQRTAHSEQSLLSSYLAGMYGIVPVSATIHSRSTDSVTISFRSDFGANVLRAPRIGCILKVPQLYRDAAPETDDIAEGPWNMNTFTQNDTWKIPADMPTSVFGNLPGKFGEGSWSREGTTVTRHFAMRRGVIASVKSGDFVTFIKERNRFAQGTIWKN